MIRRFIVSDLEQIISIWLNCNLKAHSFIPADFWKNHINLLRESLPEAEVFIYQKEKKVIAFIGLEDDYIAGLFVKDGFQSQGIGNELLNRVKQDHDKLTLSVYAKNKRALNFYLKENFKILKKKIDTDTGEEEILMFWEKDDFDVRP